METYSEFQRYCAQFGFDETPIDEELYSKLTSQFDFDDVYSFACDVYCGAVDGFTIRIVRLMDNCGQVVYGIAKEFASFYGLQSAFASDYGLAGEWEDVETGKPIGIDVGELIKWKADCLA